MGRCRPRAGSYSSRPPVADLSEQFNSPEPHLLLNAQDAPDKTLNSLQLLDVSYSFPPVDGSAPFRLGPVNLTIKQGDIVFIVGENGCGKTTLIKLLLGLYAPQQGEIRLNGQPVSAKTRDDYRQLFTTIFADYYLFDDVVQGDMHIPQDAEQYLKRLKVGSWSAAHSSNTSTGRSSSQALTRARRLRCPVERSVVLNRPLVMLTLCAISRRLRYCLASWGMCMSPCTTSSNR